MKHFLKRPNRICYISIWGLIILLNLLAWGSSTFCDAYISRVFPLWVNTYGRFSGLFPFSVGEWLLVAGVVLLLMAVLSLIGMLVFQIYKWVRTSPSTETGRFSALVSRVNRRFWTFFAWVAAVICLVMTLNCTLLYHGSSFAEKYWPVSEQEFTFEELVAVRNMVVEECNRLSQEIPRDEEGDILYTGSRNEQGESVSLEDKAIEEMQRLGESYEQFAGYYPRPKAMMFSDFMCQQYMQGYYFPFSMEANYNDVMCFINKPATLCHELVHLRGYTYEDEANFLSYLACVQSDDIFFQYSGYLSVLNYLDNDFYRAVGKDYEAYCEQVMILPQVHEDNTFVSQEEWERINSKAWLDTETVETVADTFVDTTLKLNGVADGKISYSRVVELLLAYYTR